VYRIRISLVKTLESVVNMPSQEFTCISAEAPPLMDLQKIFIGVCIVDVINCDTFFAIDSVVLIL